MEQENKAEKNWESELCQRLEQITKEETEIPAMTGKDYITAALIVAICLFFVILGAFI